MAEKEIAAFDLEGTLTSGVAWEGMRDFLYARNEGNHYRRFLWRNLLAVFAYRLGLLRDERSFKERWILDVLRLFSGYSAGRIEEMADWVVANTLWPARRSGVIDELTKHRDDGRRVLLVSGMFEPILQNIALKVQADAVGTPLKFDNGRFTGEIVGQLNVGEHKVRRLQQQPGRLAVAYGDTLRDIPMLQSAESAVAVYPDKKLRRKALQEGWRILEA